MKKKNDDSLPSRSSKTDVYKAAKSLVRSGLSVIPIRADGTKRPAFELLPKVWSDDIQRYTRPWSEFKTRRPSNAELRGWFRDSPAESHYGIAVIGGEVSGGVEIIDLDNWDVVKPWKALVQKQAPGLLDRLVLVKTPRPGMHAYYRCCVVGGSHKLAMVPDSEYDNTKPKCVIELKGAAGYCLAPPSPPACHKTRRAYSYDNLDLTQISTITPDERDVLLTSARQLNAWERPVRNGYSPKCDSTPKGTRPGDIFNARGDWHAILAPHGWTWIGPSTSGSNQWCRPGKSRSLSATTSFAGSELMYVFSTNAHPFEPDAWYTKFHAYTLLNHNGSFSAAARDLADQKSCFHLANRITDPLARYSNYVPLSMR